MESATSITKLGPYSRTLARGSLGGRIDGRSREGRFLAAFEAGLIAQIGSPTTAQRFLIRRASRAALRLELLDEELQATGELSAHGARIYSALGNSLRLCLREIGAEAAAAAVAKPPSIDSIAERHRREASACILPGLVAGSAGEAASAIKVTPAPKPRGLRQ